MGKKNKTKTNKKTHRHSAKSGTKEIVSESQTLVSQAENALSQMQLEDALGYYEQALSLDPLNCNILDSLADVYLSLGETDRALELLLKSTKVSPEDSPGKYLYIAQLQQGDEALSSYKQALYYLSNLRQRSEVTIILYGL
jgi:tetratricopeptide (TPR) repeat protein